MQEINKKIKEVENDSNLIFKKELEEIAKYEIQKEKNIKKKLQLLMIK